MQKTKSPVKSSKWRYVGLDFWKKDTGDEVVFGDTHPGFSELFGLCSEIFGSGRVVFENPDTSKIKNLKPLSQKT